MADAKRPTLAGLRSALGKTESRCQAMLEVGRSLTAVHDLDDLLRLVMELVTRITEADRSTIFLVDRDRRQVWSKVAQGETLKEIRLPLGKGIAGWVAQTGKTLNLSDAYADKRFDQDVDRRTGYRTCSILAVPLRGKQGGTLGVIEILNKREGSFSEDDERLLDAISSQVAVAVENAQLIQSVLAKNAALLETQQRLARKVSELDVLHQLEAGIAAAQSLDEMLESLLRKAVQLFRCEAGSILLAANEQGETIFASAVGPAKDEVKRLRLPRGTGVAGWVAEHGRPAIVNDPEGDGRHPRDIDHHLDFPVRNILAVPMALGGEVIGALQFLNRQRGDFGKEDEQLAALIAGQAASAIQLCRHREESEKAGRLSSIGQMLSGVIHDFRSPMAIAAGYVQLMAKDCDIAARRRHSDLVMRQFEFMTHMTNELLAFAKGETTLLLTKVYVERFVEEIAENLNQELSLSKAKLNLQCRYEGAIRVDAYKLRRVFLSLARNAREAMPDGGELAIRVEEEPDEVRFEFADTGPGIPNEVRGNLFDSFVTCGKEHGTGLGLAMAKKFIDEHGGRITADNPPAGGALFRVWLPKRPQVKLEPPTPS
ncbi:MAG: GAF domain-containing protein [Elusimicrobia bacterium]|nr:GAF domain-containing protein [Elusimicrobiota bacterium]